MSTLKVDTVRPVTTDADLALQGDASGAGVTGAKVFGDGSLGADSITDLAGTGAPDFSNGWKSEGLDAYACRAWVNFDGTGTVAIRDSGNVSSITDNGTGDYTVNFTTAMPDANYANNASVGNDEASQSNVFVRQSAFWRTYKTASACRVITGYVTPSGSSVEDRQEVNVAIFR